MCPYGAHPKSSIVHPWRTIFQFMCPYGAHQIQTKQCMGEIPFQFMCPYGAHRVQYHPEIMSNGFQFMCPYGAHPECKVAPVSTGVFQFMCPYGAHHVSSLYIAQVKNFNSCAPTGHISFRLYHHDIDPISIHVPLRGTSEMKANCSHINAFQFMCPYGAHLA